ncbi:hypothetical protein Y032_0241g3384 [Ancylostoma ceylanicum]|uniref:DUF4781 domain-containing protein n=1 Tax=Ancylostoma ceylanicum TaxID=53326 RepID=A0A016SET5_9BILA|nr:hypothetical protein Y032_0241g3384 [Ancylostoma ceylanicum]
MAEFELVQHDHSKIASAHHYSRPYKKVQGRASQIIEEASEKAEQTLSGARTIFRVRDNGGGWKFIDCALRVYKDFEDYLANNKAPRCMMCYPAGGFLRVRKQQDEHGSVFSASEIHFGEPPSCTLSAMTTETLDRISMVSSPIAALTLFWTPVGWLASGLTALSVGNVGYFFYRLLHDIRDKHSHWEDCGTEIFHFATTITALTASRAIPTYLRAVALQNRKLSSWESTIITGILGGMVVSSAVDFAVLCYHFGSNLVNESAEITALDVINLVVATQNFYSCCLSPKSAKAMLEKVKMEIYAEKSVGLVKTSSKEIDKKSLENKKEAEAMLERARMEPRAENRAKNAEHSFKKNIKQVLENKKEFDINLIDMMEIDSTNSSSRAVWEIYFKTTKGKETSEMNVRTNQEDIEIWGKEVQAMLKMIMENRKSWSAKDVIRIVSLVGGIFVKLKGKETDGKEKEMKNMRSSKKRERSQRFKELKNKIASVCEKPDQYTNETMPVQNELQINTQASSFSALSFLLGCKIINARTISHLYQSVIDCVCSIVYVEYLEEQFFAQSQDGIAKQQNRDFKAEQDITRFSNAIVDHHGRVIQPVTYLEIEQNPNLATYFHSKGVVNNVNEWSARRATRTDGEMEVMKHNLAKMLRVIEAFDNNEITEKQYISEMGKLTFLVECHRSAVFAKNDQTETIQDADFKEKAT